MTKYHSETQAMSDCDKKMLDECKRIVKNGNSAEVKIKDGKWVIYEVSKTRKQVG